MSNGSPIRNGKQIGKRRTATDAEGAARHTESMIGLAALSDAFDGIIFLCSPAHEIEYANRFLIESKGFDPVGRKCYEVLQDRDSACPWCVNDRVFRGETVRLELQNPKDGRWHSAVSMPFRKPDGTLSKVAFYRDITERKIAEEKLRESEERFHRFFEKCPVALAIEDLSGVKSHIDRIGEGGKRLDPEYFLANPEDLRECLLATRVLDVNEEFCRLFGGRSKEHVLGKARKIVGSISPENGAVILSSIAGGEKTFEMATSLTALGGQVREVVFRYLVLPGNEETFSQVIVSIMDVSSHMEAEKALKQSRATMENLARHLQFVLEKERRGIAREVHDNIGQFQAALSMDLAWLRARIPKDQTALLMKLLSMTEQVELSTRNVRKITSDLRPGFIEYLGLVAAMGRFIEEFQERTGIVCHMDVKPESIEPEQERAIALYRILQEALTNVGRHADARTVRIKLVVENGKVILQISDDGKGIDKNLLSTPRSFGLIGMRERARAFSGTFDLRGERGRGTTITVRIPLDDKGEDP